MQLKQLLRLVNREVAGSSPVGVLGCAPQLNWESAKNFYFSYTQNYKIGHNILLLYPMQFNELLL